MASEHTAKAFDVDLQELTRMVAEMGGLAERQIVESVDALIRRDVALGKRVVALDADVDRIQREIEERAVLSIARRQPMAVDLRAIVGALRIAGDLERIGDLAKNIGKRVSALDGDFLGLYVEGEDIAQSDPNTQHVTAALTAMECIVVQDLFLNETAKFAHVFLPGSSFLEKDGTFTNSERRVSRVRKVM